MTDNGGSEKVLLEAENPDEPKPCGACCGIFLILQENPKFRLSWQKRKTALFLLKSLMSRLWRGCYRFLAENSIFRWRSVVKLKNEQGIS